jgi:hypothetical protein
VPRASICDDCATVSARARKQTNFTALQNRLWKTFKLPPAAQQFVYGLNREKREFADRASRSMRAPA